MTFIPKRKKRTPYGVREPSVLRCPQFLKWLRGFTCAVGSWACEGRIEAAHVRGGTDGGVGMKPSDCYALPLCSEHHRRQHQIGEREFQRATAIDMRAIADMMWSIWTKSPTGRAWLAKNPHHAPTAEPISRISGPSTPSTPSSE